MEPRTLRLEGDDGRWLDLRVEGPYATAKVGEAEPFPFSFEHMGYVARGMGYQAWGGGSHMAFRQESDGVSVEFQGPKDRHASVCRLSEDRLRSTIDALDALAPSRSHVVVL